MSCWSIDALLKLSQNVSTELQSMDSQIARNIYRLTYREAEQISACTLHYLAIVVRYTKGEFRDTACSLRTTGLQGVSETDRQTDRQTDTHTHRETDTERERVRERE